MTTGATVLHGRFRCGQIMKSGHGVETYLGTDLEAGGRVVVKKVAAAEVTDLYLVQPFVPGITLSERLSGGPHSVMSTDRRRCRVGDVRVRVLVRIRSDRVFCPDPPSRAPVGPGRPRRHGERFALADPTTWSEPDAELTTTDSRYAKVGVQVWHGLHPKLHGRGRWSGYDQPPIVLRVVVEHLPKPSARAVKTLWLWWSGPGEPDLDTCWRAYLRRFDIEHSFRFVKSTLGWTTPSPCNPEQADRWTWLVVAAYTQLRLARGLVADHRLPRGKRRDPTQLSPARVRRGFRRLLPTIGTPASPPKSDTAGPGRPKGTRRPPRTRYPAVKKVA